MDDILKWVLIAAAAVIVIGAAAAIVRIKRKLSAFSRAAFGTDSITEGLEGQREVLAEKPKSVSSMTRLFLPQISEDFPELNYSQLKTRAENALLNAFASINDGAVGKIEGTTDDFRENLRLIIEDNRAAGIEECFSEAEIHDTQICDYRKGAGMCRIVFQSAVGYIHYESKNGETVSGDDGIRTQTKYDVEAVYIQNPELIKNYAGSGVGTVCPNCGAPVTSVGDKKCQYCGSAVEAVNIKTWLINSFKEV